MEMLLEVEAVVSSVSSKMNLKSLEKVELMVMPFFVLAPVAEVVTNTVEPVAVNKVNKVMVTAIAVVVLLMIMQFRFQIHLLVKILLN